VFPVPFDIDISRRVAGQARLAQLVEAVFDASPEDEDEFIEWKQTLDLSSREGAFHVARAVLGFANRDPAVAMRKFEGCAYLIVGVEPNNCAGVNRIDPADLSVKVDHYVGGVNGPAWDPHYLDFQGVSVLVVTVEPPRQGDPVRPLRKELTPAQDGTIFVRRKGLTARGNAAEIDMLSLRAAAVTSAAFELRCRLEPAPVCRFDLTGFMANVRAQAERQAAEMKAAADKHFAEQQSAPKVAFTAGGLRFNQAAFAGILESQYRAIAGMGGGTWVPDDRSRQDFDREVDAYVAEVVGAAETSWPAVAWKKLTDVHLVAENNTDTYLTDVRIELVFDDDRIVCLDSEPDAFEAPAKPPALGDKRLVQGTHHDLSRLFGDRVGLFPKIGGVNLSPNVWIGGDGNLVFAVGKLRPRGIVQSDRIRIVVPVEVPGPTITATGIVTAEGHHKVVPVRLVVDVA
jgi:Putative DNA-binding domain